MLFWRLNCPDYNDYQHEYVNGGLEHPFGLPGVECDVCHQTWGGSQIFPLELPVSLQKNKYLTKRWPIPIAQHKTLQQEVQNEFQKLGTTLPALQPGDTFQPCYLDIPSRPCADFLWCSIGSVVISERIRHLFESLKLTGISYAPVTLRKVGKRNARLPAPIPSTGEPEDMIEELPLLKSTNSVAPYFELIVQSESDFAPDAKPLSICSGCGWETFPETESRYEMLDSMWKGADVFFLASTYHIVVTERVHRALQNLRATNVHFDPF